MNQRSKIIIALSITFSLLSSIYSMGTFTTIKNKIVQQRNYRDIRNYLLPANAYPSVIKADTYRFIDFKNCRLFDFKHCSGNTPTYRSSADSMLQAGFLSLAKTIYTFDNAGNIEVVVGAMLNEDTANESYASLIKRLEKTSGSLEINTNSIYYYNTSGESLILLRDENLIVYFESSTVDSAIVSDFANNYHKELRQQLASP